MALLRFEPRACASSLPVSSSLSREVGGGRTKKGGFMNDFTGEATLELGIEASPGVYKAEVGGGVSDEPNNYSTLIV